MAKETHEQERNRWRDQLINMAMTECQHFSGVQRDACKVGVNYRELVGGEDLGYATRIPCLGGKHEAKNGPRAECSKFSAMPREEAEAHADRVLKSQDNCLLAMAKAHEHARASRLKKGTGGRGELPCPACEKGTLRYSVAGINGHMHAACSDQACVRWME